jgi:4-hydroxy-2-oxoheptanedioate aldolase
MIETAQAVDALEDILAVPGIDALYVGPTDLRFSLGRPPIMDGEEPEMFDMYKKILKSAGRRGVPVAMHCLTAPYARRMVEMGFRLVTIGADNVFITQGARAAVSAFRG